MNDLSLTMSVNVLLLANFQLSRLGDLPVFLDSFLLWQKFLSVRGQVSCSILNLEKSMCRARHKSEVEKQNSSFGA